MLYVFITIAILFVVFSLWCMLKTAKMADEIVFKNEEINEK